MQISERRVAKKETEIKQGKKKRTQRVRASGELVNETGPRDRFPIRRPPIDPPLERTQPVLPPKGWLPTATFVKHHNQTRNTEFPVLIWFVWVLYWYWCIYLYQISSGFGKFYDPFDVVIPLLPPCWIALLLAAYRLPFIRGTESTVKWKSWNERFDCFPPPPFLFLLLHSELVIVFC